MSEVRTGDWIQTKTGKKFYPIDPKIEEIDILDIAGCLANQCRFGGHCNEFYSVAQHSVFVSYLCGKDEALAGLLHDASEAYLVDIPSPLKRMEEFRQYRVIEDCLQRMINHKFGVKDANQLNIKFADTLALSIEACALMKPLHPEWKLKIDPSEFPKGPVCDYDPRFWILGPCEAEEEFIERFNEMTK